jgi:hypothetical protein
MRSVCLALLLSLPALSAHTATTQELEDAAKEVLVGREIGRAFFTACEPHFRQSGFDPRFFLFFWETARFEVFEGARLTLGERAERSAIDGLPALPRTAPPGERCDAVVREDTPNYRVIPGASEASLQLMREAYRSTKPNSRDARDMSLLNDCMKGNFNARQLNFDLARQRCECTLAAMRTVPAADLDGWLADARSGAGAPMSQQTWYPELFPKLQACLAR